MISSAWLVRVAAYRPYAISRPGTSCTLRISSAPMAIATATMIIEGICERPNVRGRIGAGPASLARTSPATGS
jgi:hypothetical protein